jgi:pimeloyl-ACP methyl ester carboxylesterase
MSTNAIPDSGNHEFADGIEPAPSTSKFVEAGGLRLHYLDYGSAGRQPMLCVHGGGAHAHWYDFVAPGLSADYHVRSIDLRGHGDSPWVDPPDYSYERFAADLAEAVEKLDLRDFILVGHSMGGMVSLVYSSQYPGRVSRLIVVDSNLKIKPDFVTTMRERGSRPPFPYATLEELQSRYRLRPEGTTAPPERIRYLGGKAGRQQPDGKWQHKFDRNVYAKRVFVAGMPCWDRIRIPSLLVRGMLSDRITPQIFEEVRSRCPTAELAEVPGSYHHVTVDNPAVLVNEIRAFLARHA